MARNKTLADAREDRRRDGERAIAEGHARAEAINKNMARLRKLRLEREAAGEAPEVKKEPVKPRSALEKYLAHQKRIGRA